MKTLTKKELENHDLTHAKAGNGWFMVVAAGPTAQVDYANDAASLGRTGKGIARNEII